MVTYKTLFSRKFSKSIRPIQIKKPLVSAVSQIDDTLTHISKFVRCLSFLGDHSSMVKIVAPYRLHKPLGDHKINAATNQHTQLMVECEGLHIKPCANGAALDGEMLSTEAHQNVNCHLHLYILFITPWPPWLSTCVPPDLIITGLNEYFVLDTIH